MDKRTEKRWKRENRQNKGAGTAAKGQKRNAAIRAARQRMGGWSTQDENMLLLAASLMGRRR